MNDSTVIAYADHAAAKYAVERWHYSRKLPLGKTVKVGLWEPDDDGALSFRGVAIFSTGVGNLQAIGFKYGLRREQTCELARVALTTHEIQVSQFLTEALRLVRDVNPDLQLVVSYADPAAGHVGRIYQAMNWSYHGTSAMLWEKYLGGKWRHNRTIGRATSKNPLEGGGKTQFGQVTAPITPEVLDAAPTRWRPAKFRYLYAFDKPLRRRVQKDGLPYPDDEDLAVQVSRARQRTSGAKG